MLCCRGQLAQHALGFIAFLSFHTEVLTTNWLPVELSKPANVEANAPKCPAGLRDASSHSAVCQPGVPKVSTGSAAVIPKRSIDQRPKSN